MKRTGSLRLTNSWLGRITGWKLARVPDKVKSETDTLQFYVPLRECISSYGFAYGADIGYHPLTALLREYECNPKLTYKESSLHTFYQRFNPRSLQEALLGQVLYPSCATARISLTDNVTVKMRVCAGIGDGIPLPWSIAKEIRNYVVRKHTHLAASQTGESHFRRTLEVYRSIKAVGFDPHRYADGSLKHSVIRVVILKHNDSERVVIIGGQHRVAALATLGWKRIPVIFDYHLSARPPVIDLRNAAHWSVVKEGIYDLAAAHRVFEALFTDYGRGKVEHFGLARDPSPTRGGILART